VVIFIELGEASLDVFSAGLGEDAEALDGEVVPVTVDEVVEVLGGAQEVVVGEGLGVVDDFGSAVVAGVFS
jgi:hypothetical protein